MAADPTRTKRDVAVIGTGYWGKHLVRNMAGLGRLGTICDATPRTLAAIGASYPEARATTEIEDVLRDPSVRSVMIATPASTHASLARRSLEAGKHVFVEKPLSLSVREGEQLVQLAEEKRLTLMVGHLLHYHPCVRRLKELIAGGALGPLRHIYSNRLNLGMIRSEENVLWSFAPHDISLILGLVGKEPESVRAFGGCFLDSETADVTVTSLQFEGGVRAHVFVSWLHPFKEQRLVVVGESGMAVFDDTAPWARKLTVVDHRVTWEDGAPVASKSSPRAVEVDEGEPLREECSHFLRCVDQGETPLTDGAEGLRVLAVLSACQKDLERMEGVARTPSASPSDREGIHETAVVDPEVTIGSNTRVWHFSHVLSGSTIGRDCTIGQNVMIGPDVAVGDNCKIQNNVSIYKGVTLEEDVFCGPSMVFTNVINPRSAFPRKDEFRETLVERGSSIGANATILCGRTLGHHCMIGAGAVVTKDVPPHALVVGNPAKVLGWVCECGVRLDEDDSCPACRREYRRGDRGLEPTQR